eukprot:Gregarina_sp_Pseudo_9__1338@NODE_1898_length_1269_cov_5_650407_g1760_i0_p2_GENE_NODE_1898_length_1269_cov_5_650407_g1760_i0NODE_1898_length_1269_cov_5_650407_g1760_i0_p2_ORF_typecomplete_len184_score14_20CRR7/PF12095_8/7CRR7/PF12095_8/87_NODE_1898_length_1269_cov_5_650407_g1760_i0127678
MVSGQEPPPETLILDDDDDQFVVCIPEQFQQSLLNGEAGPHAIPKLLLQASKSLPHSLHSFSTIKPYEAPKSEKLRHKPELMKVEFANDDGNSADGCSSNRDCNDEEEAAAAATSPQQIISPSKKNLKFKQLLARFQSSISPRTASDSTTADDPLEWLEDSSGANAKAGLRPRSLASHQSRRQ